MQWNISDRKEGETMAEKNTTQKELTCICCPVGCALTVIIADDSSVTVTGNRCPRGAAYGEKEVTHPTRIVTSTVRTSVLWLSNESSFTRPPINNNRIKKTAIIVVIIINITFI